MNVHSSKKLLVYGCNGYTAKLLLPRLRALGLDVIAAGRNHDAVERVAIEFGSEPRVFDLNDPKTVDAAVREAAVVLNAAGPFAHTAPRLIDACLRERVDYLDLSGELAALEYAARYDAFARTLGIMLLPAIGFDVVPSDCLALHLLERLPGAQHLSLCISPSNLLSRGSARTLMANAGIPIQIRRSGVLEPMRLRTQMRWVDFGAGERPVVAVTWGDLVTAFHTTRIPNIEVYFEATAFRLCAVAANQWYGRLFNDPAVRSWVEWLARMIPDGPSGSERETEQSVMVAEVTDGRRRERVRLVTPEAYTFTAEVASRIVAEVFAGRRRPGFVTPAALFGSDFTSGMRGVNRESLQ